MNQTTQLANSSQSSIPLKNLLPIGLLELTLSQKSIWKQVNLAILAGRMSKRMMVSNSISNFNLLVMKQNKENYTTGLSITAQCTKFYNPKIVFVANWPPLQFDNWTYFATIDVLHCCLSEEEVDVILILQSIDKIRGWKLEKIRILE